MTVKTREDFDLWWDRTNKYGINGFGKPFAWQAWQAATKSAKRVPMTDEQMQVLWRLSLGDGSNPRRSAFSLIRAIEHHHGITGDGQ